MEEKERFWEISIDCFVYFASARKWMRFGEKKLVRFVTPIRWQESTRIFKVNVICVFIMHTLSADSQYLTLGIWLEVFKRDLSGNLSRKTSAMRIDRKN